MNLHFCPICVAAMALSGVGYASVINVPVDQTTIQAGINAAANGDTVRVAPGTYYENLNFNGKAITVAGSQTAIGNQGSATIIDGGHHGSVVTFNSGEGAQSVLTGFTIQNGTAAFDGGGIQISNSSPTIAINNIVNNTANADGGGIAVSFGSPNIHDNLISNNAQSAGYSGGNGEGIYIGGSSAAQVVHNQILNNVAQQGAGGGIALFAAGSALIQGNYIGNNHAYSQGGGIWIVNDSSALIVNNVIYGNNSGLGGGIYWLVPSGSRGPFAVNNTIADNTASSGAAVLAGGFQGQAQLINNILTSPAGSVALFCDPRYGNTAPVTMANDAYSGGGAAYSGTCAGFNGTAGNISADPLFSNNLFLYGLTPASPAIDTGISSQAPATDINLRPRPLDGNGDGTSAFDMGAYEMQAQSSVAVASSANPAGSAQSITFTATVTPVFATGTMQFFDGSASLGTASVINGIASITVTLTAGTHSISATFNSTNPSYIGSASPPFTETVKTSPVTSLTASPNPTTPGTVVTVIASVSPSAATGTVQFLDGASPIGSATLSGGTAQLAVSTFAPGTHSLTAYYSGDANFAASTSPVSTLVVAKGNASIAVTATPNPVVFGQTETINVTLTPGTATGTVQFFDGSSVLGTATVSNGSAFLATTTLAVGTHSLSVAYSGDATYNSGTSPVTSLVVNKIATSTGIASSANPAVRNQNITFTASVTPASATGNVSFYNGSTLLGTVPLSAGAASLTTSHLVEGTQPIKAVYAGNQNYAGSTSPVLNEVVSKH